MDSKLKKILIGVLAVVIAFCAYVLIVRSYYQTTYGSVDQRIVETEMAARSISVKDLRGDTSNNSYGIRNEAYDYIQSQTKNYTPFQIKLLLKGISMELIAVYDKKDNADESVKASDIAGDYLLCFFRTIPNERFKEDHIVKRILKKQQNTEQRKIVAEFAENYYNGHGSLPPSEERCKEIEKEVSSER